MLAPPGAKTGDPILQPGPFDGGQPSQDRIATLVRWLEPKAGSHNNLEGGLALVADPYSVSAEIESVGSIKGVGVARPGMKVVKVGRTTGRTSGEILKVNTAVDVGWWEGHRRFGNVIVCKAMSAGGDSGAILIDDERRALGILIAGSPDTSIYLPIQPVLDALRVALLTEG